jgi:hypothetical protein
MHSTSGLRPIIRGKSQAFYIYMTTPIPTANPSKIPPIITAIEEATMINEFAWLAAFPPLNAVWLAAVLSPVKVVSEEASPPLLLLPFVFEPVEVASTAPFVFVAIED